MIQISFHNLNVRVAHERWLFASRHIGRFEWMALLAYRRVKPGITDGWVTIEDIGRLPNWKEKTRHHIGTNVGRYLDALEGTGVRILEAESRWVGPYRLNMGAPSITFDISMEEVERRLQIRQTSQEIPREQLRKFVFRYSYAQLLFYDGRLMRNQLPGKRGPAAYGTFLELAEDRRSGSRLRLIAVLAATRVLFRLARFEMARTLLTDYSQLARTVHDQVLEAQFHLAEAWSYQRAESGTKSNRAVERSLSAARGCAEGSGDRASLGLLAYRTSGFLTKKGRHSEALEQLTVAIGAALIVGNVDTLQAYCAEMGSIMHRLGLKSYLEARRWLLTGIAIARWMKIGGDDAHGEMILGKMYAELSKQPNLSRFWLRRAQGIAAGSRNDLNLADVKMVWAFWHLQFGSRRDLIATLAEALRIYRRLPRFDYQQKERYMARKFPSVWPEVVKSAIPPI